MTMSLLLLLFLWSLFLCSLCGRKLNVAHVDGIADIQLRNIYGNSIWQITRQTLDGERPQALLKQSAKSLNADRRASRLQRNFSLDGFIHGNGMKIDMDNLTTHWRMLYFLYQRGPVRFFARDLEVNQVVFA